MNIKELKELIADLDDNMELGGVGHYGEKLECYGVFVTTVKKTAFGNDNDKEKILSISIESASLDPD